MVYLLVEEKFAQYPWCQRILRGLYEEARKKRTEVQEVHSPEEPPEGWGFILLVGASEQWVDCAAVCSKNRGLHPVVLSNRQNNPLGASCSSVVMDIHGSMRLAVDYLHSLGRQELALYGVNPYATSDPWRVKRFQDLTGRSEHIFYSKDSLEALWGQFYPVIDRYDGVICASDYAAVSLARRLRQVGYALPQKLYMIGYGDMNLSRLFTPSITSISDDYESFGKAALSICSLVEKADAVSTINIHLHSRLYTRDTTENRPYQGDYGMVSECKSPSENKFYSDAEISDLATLETLFNQCDDVDFALIQLLLKNAPYSTMAQECFISETAAKYRVKKMEKICGVPLRDGLIHHLNTFF